ncbi:alpha/beta fold hydrolase [Oenococcus alcoholitolerans]|uniref:Alpha/beta hydrolase n=1 Tax=Oenococcus alcoholitolerans TaxID=931074 RepID=A0ABR4XSI8_9LACO|nr:alpha/beta hydrolase [Oenococcus alcoholitolerans]
MAYLYTNDHVRLDYHELGDPKGPTVILIEGYSGNEMTWVGQIDPFIEAGFHLVTYDRRNHGKSQSVNYGMRIARHGYDLAELIDKVAFDQKVFLVGHSMGASTIFAYLSLFGCDHLKGIVTEDQSPKAINDQNWSLGLYDSDWDHLLAMAERIKKTKFTRLAVSRDFKIALGKVYRPFDFDFNQPLLLDSLVQDWRDQIETEKVPHLFLAGGNSPLWPKEEAQAAAALNQRASFHIFQGAGHIPHLEKTDEFNQTVIDFIRNNQKR